MNAVHHYSPSAVAGRSRHGYTSDDFAVLCHHLVGAATGASSLVHTVTDVVVRSVASDVIALPAVGQYHGP
jgi:hypothetical protein